MPPPPARIAFDAAPLGIPHSPGLARVVEHCLDALEARGRIEVVRMQPAPGQSLRHWRQVDWPAQLRRLAPGPGGSQTGGSDSIHGVHSFQAAIPLRIPQPRVQTLHELSWRHGVRERGTWRRIAWVQLGKRRAQAIVTATDFTARDIGIPLAAQGGKLHVIPWAPGPSFAPIEAQSPCAREDERRLAALPLPFDPSTTPFVLSPGGFVPKKRPGLLAEGVAQWNARSEHKGPPLQVIWTSPFADMVAKDPSRALVQQPHAHLLFEIEDRTLAALYRQAKAVCVLSRSEGFALPVLEAMASGTSVIVTPQSAQAEVAGPLGIVAPKATPAGIANALQRLLEDRPQQATELAQYARSFTWQKTAEHIEDLWKSIL